MVNGSSPSRSASAPEFFAGADHARRAFELLDGQQSQGVAGEDRRAKRRFRTWMGETAMQQVQRGQPQVGFGLAASGWKPDQIQHPPVFVPVVQRRRQSQQDEGQLKSPPGGGWPIGSARPHGHRHGAVGEAERFPDRIIMPQ